MDIAVLIAGEYREFDIAHKSWPFINWDIVDYYVSTWSTTCELNHRLDINIEESVTIDRFSMALGHIINYSIDEPANNLIGTTNKMLDRWITGLNLINKSRKRYDYIVLIRPDLYLDFDQNLFLDFLKATVPGVIYSYTGGAEIVNSVQDQLIIGTSASMLKLVELDAANYTPDTNIHWFLAQEFKRLIGKIDHIPFENFSICRSNCRGLNLTFDLVKKNAKEWYESKYHHEIKICDMPGFSGSKVELYRTLFGKKFVRKSGNVERNSQQLRLLNYCGFTVPAIIASGVDYIDMEYIQGMDIKTYLCRFSPEALIRFFENVFDRFSKSVVMHDYSNIYLKNLKFYKLDTTLPFKIDELFERLPKYLPRSTTFHGDFTLENLIYSDAKGFTMIDVASGDYDSYIFDIAKMRQDLDCKWFLRNTSIDISAQLIIIKNFLMERYPAAFNDNLYILMLLRVYKYCQPDSEESKILLREIKRLWK